MQSRMSPRGFRGNQGRRRRWPTYLAPIMGVIVACALSVFGTATGASSAAKTAATTSVAPSPANELDCNGWNAKYQTVRKMAGANCVDPISIANGKGAPFYDNWHYVGHDEPSVKFISGAPGSGNTMSYLMKVPTDPSRAPTPSGSVTDYGELSVAPWFGLPVCDPLSYPMNPCTPDSDSNQGSISNPADAGSAFMELQLYPPGYTPFIDSESCSATKWCAALTIDSLECQFGIVNCNPDCEEPVNFAFLQTNGVPTGPPSPQLTDASTFLPNAHTLMISPGDVLQVSITDPQRGFTTTIRDLSTGKTGYMTASAANGFMNTSYANCDGTPFTFHAEYNTASVQNQVPWAALEGGVLMEQEIGHSESCNSVTGQDPYSVSYPGGQSYTDTDTYDTCTGGSEGPDAVGEGPCNATTGVCQNPTTQGPDGPVACPNDNFNDGSHCEYADGFCFAKGTRTVQINGVNTTAFSRSNQCFADRYQNGDLDFDGLSYQSYAWPNGTRNHPTAAAYLGPFDAQGKPYPQVQFESDIGGSEELCDTATGVGCTTPPISADFYPFWSLGRAAGLPAGNACVWNFGNVIPTTVKTFGKDAEYGTPDVARYGGTSISPVMANPELAGRCR
jgi:hypothetical protein